jgi:hypothetical protein
MFGMHPYYESPRAAQSRPDFKRGESETCRVMRQGIETVARIRGDVGRPYEELRAEMLSYLNGGFTPPRAR